MQLVQWATKLLHMAVNECKCCDNEELVYVVQNVVNIGCTLFYRWTPRSVSLYHEVVLTDDRQRHMKWFTNTKQREKWKDANKQIRPESFYHIKNKGVPRF